MVCFPHMVTRLYAYGVAVADGLTPVNVSSKLDCIRSCTNSRTCSSFFFRQQTNSCYFQNRWLNNLVTSPTSGDANYFVIGPEHCLLPDYQFVRSVGMCLKFTSEKTTWPTAKTSCESNGARLVKIDSEEKMSAIMDIMTSDYIGINFWIGAEDPQLNSHWVWTDGSALEYAKWAPHEPSSGKACVQIWQNGGGFDDASCDGMSGNICEKL